MKLPTGKTVLFWHASVSVVVVRVLYMLSIITSRFQSIEGVATFLFEIFLTIVVYCSLATLLAFKANEAQRSPEPVVEVRRGNVPIYAVGRRRDRLLVQAASWIWSFALIGNVSIFTILGLASARRETWKLNDIPGVFKPLVYIFSPLIFTCFLSNFGTAIYIRCVWPRTAVKLFSREAPNEVPQNRQPGGLPPAYTALPGGPVDVELGTLPATTANGNGAPKPVDVLVSSWSGLFAGSRLRL
ncbi:hypothetical protein F5X68DRAFT_196764 [Plectosphaerella plurivora]|uniref:Uncharacterized protein n=1 Tax=Plectosphaerella plurivora TaxID=936078 RepID=A0A9P9AGC8_9PEZI|nr:hypothetical protein F5X68DRAFT_196764 [Plectosphaerella plurivora]